MSKVFVMTLSMLTIALACCFVPERSVSLAGTWAIYAGGNAGVNDVLHFDEDGTGEAYQLPQDYEEVWLRGEPVPDELLMDQHSFQWRVTGEANEQLHLNFLDGSSLSYELTYEEDLDGTGLPGITLSDGFSGSGWVQVSLENN